MKRLLLVLLVAFNVSAQEQPASQRFYQAIRNDELETLRLLVKTLGADVRDPLGQTPLMIAAAFGTEAAIKLLVAGGADVKAVSDAGVTALHWATRDVNVVRALLDGGADVNAKSTLGRTPLLVAASTSGTVDVVALLLEKGADINTVDNTGVSPLIAAASVDDAAVAKLLLAKGAAVNTRATGVGQSATALMGAAYNGNAELTRLLLERHADLELISSDRAGTVKNGAVQFGNVTALHMGTASGSVDTVRQLLDAGAKVDPLDVRGMTPLMWSVSTDRPQPRVVRMLLDKGADASIRSNVGESAVDWARKFDNPAVFAELRLPAAQVTAPLAAARADGSPTSREAVERSMPLLRNASAKMMTAGGCVACHAQPLTVMAADLASARGWPIERAGADSALVASALSAAAQGLMQAREGGGLPDTQVYNVIMMASQKTPPNPATDALAHYLAAKQRQDGNWHGVGATRAPIQDGDFSRTAMSIRALAVYGTPARKREFAARIERAASWLAAQTPVTTEDRVMQLLGLTWANANAPVREVLTRELIAEERPGGGWAQTRHLASDAYATGQVLYALREVGVPDSDGVYQRGTSYLLRTQRDDGSWYVKSRAMKIQPYFESGFPYGHDQWISQTGTSWAVMALSRTAVTAP